MTAPTTPSAECSLCGCAGAGNHIALQEALAQLETAEELARDAVQERDAMRAALRAVQDCRHAGTDQACLECLACQRLDLQGSAAAMARAEEMLASVRAAMAGLALEHAKELDQIRARHSRLEATARELVDYALGMDPSLPTSELMAIQHIVALHRVLTGRETVQ